MVDCEKKNRDILYEIYNKYITEDEAEALYTHLFMQFHNFEFKITPDEYFLLSVSERTAYIMHHISFTTLSVWRYEGWPAECGVCGNYLDVKKGNWKAFELLLVGEIEKRNVLVHWDCDQRK